MTIIYAIWDCVGIAVLSMLFLNLGFTCFDMIKENLSKD